MSIEAHITFHFFLPLVILLVVYSTGLKRGFKAAKNSGIPKWDGAPPPPPKKEHWSEGVHRMD